MCFLWFLAQIDALRGGAAIVARASRGTDAAWEIIADAAEQLDSFRADLESKYMRKSRIKVPNKRRRPHDGDVHHALDQLVLGYHRTRQTAQTLQLSSDNRGATGTSQHVMPALTIMVSNVDELSPSTLADLLAVLDAYRLAPVRVTLILVVSAFRRLPVPFAEGVLASIRLSEVTTVSSVECYSTFLEHILMGGLPIQVICALPQGAYILRIELTEVR